MLALPFVALWRLLELLLSLTGRLLALTIGLVLMLIGGLLTATVVGGIIGIPLLILGGLLLLRAIF